MAKLQKPLKLLLIISSILIFYSLFWGPLFAYNPIKLNYEKIKGENYELFYKNKLIQEPCFKNVDTYILQFEKDFRLRSKKNVKIIITEESDLKRFMPWKRTTGMGGMALQTGDVLYINVTPIYENSYNIEEYIKHELVHLLTYQNSGVINALKMDQMWMIEGVPVAFGGPNYYTNEEFERMLQENEFRDAKPSSGEGGRVYYTVYGKFIKFLCDKYGKEVFNTFLETYTKDPSDWNTHFENIFESDFESVEKEFVKELLPL